MNHNTDTIIENVMSHNVSSSNTVSNGYKFYKPLGVRQISDNESNQILNINGTNVYLYVDIISYYYKNILNYSADDSYDYYYKKINNNGIEGYVGINKINSDYFVKIVYNYSKIEFYTDYNNLDGMLAYSLIILKSIKYNDNLIDKLLSNGSNTSMDISYQLEGPVGDKNAFSKFLEEYIPEEDDEEIVLPTEE